MTNEEIQQMVDQLLQKAVNNSAKQRADEQAKQTQTGAWNHMSTEQKLNWQLGQEKVGRGRKRDTNGRHSLGVAITSDVLDEIKDQVISFIRRQVELGLPNVREMMVKIFQFFANNKRSFSPYHVLSLAALKLNQDPRFQYTPGLGSGIEYSSDLCEQDLFS